MATQLDLANVICFLRPHNLPTRKEIQQPALAAFLKKNYHEQTQPKATWEEKSSSDLDLNRRSSSTSQIAFPDVIQLRFDAPGLERSSGVFTFGNSEEDSVIQFQSFIGDEKQQDWFEVFYIFEHCSLMIKACIEITAGKHLLFAGDTAFLTPGMEITVKQFSLVVEYPDLVGLEAAHKANYEKYATKYAGPNKYVQWFETPSKTAREIGVDLVQVRVLGSGAFGEVVAARHRWTGLISAVKIIKDPSESAKTEAQILKSLDHDNIVKFKGAFELDNLGLCIEMEYGGSSLDDQLKRSTFTIRTVQSISRQCLLGLEYIHGRNIMHRDIKPANILCTNWDVQRDLPIVKLADFGLAFMGLQNGLWCGTEGYMAPELIELRKSNAPETFGEYYPAINREMMADVGLNGEEYTESVLAAIFASPSWVPPYTNAVDIFAMGRVVEDLCWKLKVIGVWSNARIKLVPTALIGRMLQKVPQNRPTAIQCLLDPWLRASDDILGKRDAYTGEVVGQPSGAKRPHIE